MPKDKDLPKHKPFMCPRWGCDAAFENNALLTIHVDTVHDKRRDHKCTQCELAFGRAGHLRRHISDVHERRKDHPCPQCGRPFARAADMRVHMRTLHGHRCPHCKIAFLTAHELEMHNSGTHGAGGGGAGTVPVVAVFTCVTCGRAFDSEADRDGHVMVEHPEHWAAEAMLDLGNTKESLSAGMQKLSLANGLMF